VVSACAPVQTSPYYRRATRRHPHRQMMPNTPGTNGLKPLPHMNLALTNMSVSMTIVVTSFVSNVA
jgi:hypothetical protein